jgi:hypothetical protein
MATEAELTRPGTVRRVLGGLAALAGALLTLVYGYLGLAWTLLLLGVWCIEGPDCESELVLSAFGVVTGIAAVVGTAAAAWAVLLGARFALTARRAFGLGRAIGVALACLAVGVLFGWLVVSVSD